MIARELLSLVKASKSSQREMRSAVLATRRGKVHFHLQRNAALAGQLRSLCRQPNDRRSERGAADSDGRGRSSTNIIDHSARSGRCVAYKGEVQGCLIDSISGAGASLVASTVYQRCGGQRGGEIFYYVPVRHMETVLVSKDLIFISKVREVAASLGKTVVVVKSEGKLKELSGAVTSPGVLLIDLEKSGIALEAIAATYLGLAERGWRAFSFFSHVHDQVSARAEELGLGEVMPRSRFVKVLPEVLGSL